MIMISMFHIWSNGCSSSTGFIHVDKECFYSSDDPDLEDMLESNIREYIALLTLCNSPIVKQLNITFSDTNSFATAKFTFELLSETEDN
jgi:hypothetical protein